MFAIPEFRAPWCLPSPHPQTIAGRFLRKIRPLPLTRERWDTPDGDFVDVDFAPRISEDAPLVVLFHGLEGSAQRGYALQMYSQLAAHGISAAGLNFRSCSGELNRTARFYHSGETEDIRFVIGKLHERFPNVPIGAIGFSLGGNAMLKYLGEEGEAVRLKAAVAVSVPYDLAAGDAQLAKSRLGRFYVQLFVKSLTGKMEAKKHLLPNTCDMEKARRAQTFREFDDAITAPLHGFRDADDYYARSSSAGFLERIRIPTLLLHAEDDPFLPADAIPRRQMAANPCITASIQKQGGHVGFIYGSPAAPRFWAEENAARFLAGILRSGSA